MPHRKLAVALSLIVVAASPVLARPAPRDPGSGAPAAGPNARYCLRVEPVTGSLIGGVRCWTRQEWAELGLDVDKEWAKEGVRVIE
ncbi:MAG: hypothetical protein QOJ94_2628 [Sphingomonadales bacterium]|jgi:hypothetical protein|nr:hypothetical protein [Sphingomonadales bacterium]